eukprot:Lithocolla_globosa_v1_NODE_6508_length_1075_cov_24595.605882.p2 type:complete len:139 gc:universal NODE_6508_length_1075_cov_24595.605882:1036-620(-)
MWTPKTKSSKSCLLSSSTQMLERSDLLLDFVFAFLVCKFLGGEALLLLWLLGFLLDVLGLSTDGSMSTFVHSFNVVTVDAGLDEARKFAVVGLGIITLQLNHVVTNVDTKDAFTEHFSVEFLAGGIVTRESLLVVGNV